MVISLCEYVFLSLYFFENYQRKFINHSWELRVANYDRIYEKKKKKMKRIETVIDF